MRANRMTASGQLFASLTLASVASIGGLMAIEGTLSLGALAACTLISNRVVQPVMRIIGVWGQFETARLAEERYSPLLALPRRAVSPRLSIPASLELRDISMGEESGAGEGRAPGMSAIVRPAEIIGIVSRDYAKRSQILNILRGALSPDRGSVLIDGADPASPGGDALMQGVFFLAATPATFRSSILDNISMFGAISHGEAIATARALGLEAVIQALPEGYDTLLGDIGASALAADILQAICVVRAVAMRPRLLVLDVRRIPPDDVSTRACALAIKELRGRTTIVIFGKYLSELTEADRIFALQDWRLEPVPRSVSDSVSERGRQLIADRLDIDTGGEGGKP